MSARSGNDKLTSQDSGDASIDLELHTRREGATTPRGGREAGAGGGGGRMLTSSVGGALGSNADQLEEDRRTRHWQVERTAVRLQGVSRVSRSMIGRMNYHFSDCDDTYL